MAAQYIIRVDDICPTMDWRRWDVLEECLIAQGVKPLLAVIPDNRDPMLYRFPPNAAFWDRVRAWQRRGWTIGLHGYQHLYTSTSRGISGCGRAYSEFAGVPFDVQCSKLRAGAAIFEREGVIPEVWVAPAHAFDKNTVRALRQVGIRTISDGLHLYPYADPDGMLWIPQQIGKFRWFPVGIWTVCIHLDDPLYAQGKYLETNIVKIKGQIVSVPQMEERYARHQLTQANKWFASSLVWIKRMAESWSGVVRDEV